MSTALFFHEAGREGKRVAFQAGLNRRLAGSAITGKGKSGPLMD
jgi:hypothetical protein